MVKNALCSWSGGKDSCFALMEAIAKGIAPKVLLNVMNEEGKISRSHGIPADILRAQAASAGFPIKMISSSWNDYEEKFTAALLQLKNEYSLTHAVFGDIDLQAHRDWEEKVCDAAKLTAVLPLWQRDRRQVVIQMLAEGIETMIVSCNEAMGKEFVGGMLTMDLVEQLVSIGVDPCGENGQFHTLVLNCPLFSTRVHVEVTGVVKHEHYWFSQLALEQITTN